MEASEYYYYHKVEGSDKLLLIFSALNIRPPKFSLFKKAQTLGINVLFFNTPSYEWYRNGIKGIGDTEEVVKFIKNLKEEQNINSIYTFGTSMGGYGAILYGALCGAKKIFACCTEPVIGIPGGRTTVAQNNYLYAEYTDLRAVGLNNIIYLYGQTDPADCIGAYMISSANPGNLVFSLPDAGHDVVDRLNSQGYLLPMIEEVINDRLGCAFDGLHKGGVDRETYLLISRVSCLKRELNFKEVLHLTDKNNVLKKSAFLRIARCIALYKLGKYPETITETIGVLKDFPKSWEPWSILSSACVRISNLPMALKAIDISLALRPAISTTLAIKADILVRMGKKAAALTYYSYAVTINPRQTSDREKFDKLKKELGQDIELPTKADLVKKLLTTTNFDAPRSVNLDEFATKLVALKN